MAPDTVKVTLGRTTLDVPLIEDEETTLRLAEQVNDRIAAMEAHAQRIDSMAFALQAAFSFAADLYRARQTHEKDDREATVALERIIQALREVLESAPDGS